MNKYAELLRRAAGEIDARTGDNEHIVELYHELRAAADEIERGEPVYQVRLLIRPRSRDRWWDTTKQEMDKLLIEEPEAFEGRVLYRHPALVAPADEWKAAISRIEALYEEVTVGQAQGLGMAVDVLKGMVEK